MRAYTDYGTAKNPRASANIFSALTFFWTHKIFIKGLHYEFDESDLSEPLKEHTSSLLGDQVEEIYEKHKQKAEQTGEQPSLIKAVAKVFWFKVFLYGLLLFVMEIPVKLLQPFFLALLLRFLNPENARRPFVDEGTYLWRIWNYYSETNKTRIFLGEAYFFASGVGICTFLNVFLLHPYMMATMHMGMKIRVAYGSLIYRKALALSKTALGQTTAGQIVNLVANDLPRFDNVVLFMHYLWLSPLQTLIILYCLQREIGVAAYMGIVVILICIPFQIYLGFLTVKIRRKTAKRTDNRVRQMNEIIQGMQVIKMYTWESAFAKLIDDSRRKEMREIKKTSYIKGTIMSFIIFTSRLGVFAAVLVYVLRGGNITIETVFVISNFCQIMRQTMSVYFPQGVVNLAEAIVSIHRIQHYMLNDEALLSNVNPLDSVTFSNYKRLNRDLGTIRVSDVSVRWESGDLALRDINMNLATGELLILIGTTGSGKTTLVNTLIAEISPFKGMIEIGGMISYSCQEPWLFAGSVRQNILFGRPFDRQRYYEVINCCALATDLKLLPFGDRTIVGERGLSLSGGQRARINLARCVYKPADIYILEDPLSAVDTHVGKHIFEKCICEYLKGQTRILVTHQLQFCRFADYIIILDKGAIQAEGTYNHLQRRGLNFSLLQEQQSKTALDVKEKKSKEEVQTTLRRISVISTQSRSSKIGEGLQPVAETEVRSTGGMDWSVFGTYFKAGGSDTKICIIFFLYLVTQALANGSDTWITAWVNEEEDNPMNDGKAIKFGLSRTEYIYIYGFLMALTTFVALYRAFLFFDMCTESSINLHNAMFRSVISGTMHFFNTNSSGRILNRFSKDMGQIDELLPQALIDFFQITLNTVGVVVLVGVISLHFIIPSIIIVLMFYFIRIYYIAAGRSIKRLEGITRSPIYNHLNASLQGLGTIRAFGAQHKLVKEFDHHQDLHNTTWYLYIALARAFGYWLDTICAVFITFITFFFLILRESTGAGEAGLAITQAIGMTGMFQWGMRQSTEVENQMTSVERVLEYTKIEHEKNLFARSAIKKPPSIWPRFGKIEFRDVYLRYSSGSSPVIKNLNIIVEPREKIGIVGRTGAGKSSLISALFRLGVVEGDIVIDQISIQDIALHDFRKKISIIPQEPVLFTGTMRYNLDPFREYNDETLMRALEAVDLQDVCCDEIGGLNMPLSEGGENFSVGQRQLVCLARAIIRNNRILIMDEATANIDHQTDELIQSTIREQFSKCTVLTIAHRLNTIMDSDKVLVMDAGCMVEFNHPHLLLQDANGYFTKMVNETGTAMADELKSKARNYYTRKI